MLRSFIIIIHFDLLSNKMRIATEEINIFIAIIIIIISIRSISRICRAALTICTWNNLLFVSSIQSTTQSLSYILNAMHSKLKKTTLPAATAAATAGAATMTPMMANEMSHSKLFRINLQMNNDDKQLVYEPSLDENAAKSFMQTIKNLMDDVSSVTSQIRKIAQPMVDTLAPFSFITFQG